MNQVGRTQARSAAPELDPGSSVVAAPPDDATTLPEEASRAVLDWSSRLADGEPWATIEREAIAWSGGQPDVLWLLIVAARSASATPE